MSEHFNNIYPNPVKYGIGKLIAYGIFKLKNERFVSNIILVKRARKEHYCHFCNLDLFPAEKTIDIKKNDTCIEIKAGTNDGKRFSVYVHVKCLEWHLNKFLDCFVNNLCSNINKNSIIY